jgi:hypothetical protein
MPYNNAAIPPQKEPMGTTQLPRKPLHRPVLLNDLHILVSRIKKMIMLDAEIHVCAASAAFVIAVATVSLCTSIRSVIWPLLNKHRKCSYNIWRSRDIMLSNQKKSLVVTFNTGILVRYISTPLASVFLYGASRPRAGIKLPAKHILGWLISTACHELRRINFSPSS